MRSLELRVFRLELRVKKFRARGVEATLWG